ncbi:hypothetical protein Tco_1344023 [Tanacetum coccineum]
MKGQDNSFSPNVVESDYVLGKNHIHRFISRKTLLGKLSGKSIKMDLNPPLCLMCSMKGSGLYKQKKVKDLFDEFERFRAIGNEPIHDYFVHFHKLVNDMKITQLEIPTHQLNTKFVNNLPSYGLYVTNVKQNMDISTTNYVHIYTHLKAYEPHATKTLKKQEQSSSIIDPLAYMAQATPTTSLPPPSTFTTITVVCLPNEALMATMTQIANLLSGFLQAVSSYQ